ncbi:MAG: exonuclease domain-containing protein [Sphingobacteriales bacterium]
MEFAIVDIETTGGYASANSITEIAIHIYDGNKIVQSYESLINPVQSIPRYIQALTGITNETVAEAPVFEDAAKEIFELLHGRIFVAHNVNFDYSFVKHHLDINGYTLNSQKLCTVRLGKKVFPQLPSYSLGNLCRSLEIEIENRHRAGGDCLATVKLFEKILHNGGLAHIEQALKRGSREQYLPLHLDKAEIDQLPYSPGVYYFHDQKGKIIYVGKAKNLKFRVRSHFTGTNIGPNRQEFIRNIHKITFNECGTELMAAVFECNEIKRLWPKYNRSLKRFEQVYGLYMYEDRNGYQRLIIEKKKKNLQPVYTFSLLMEGRQLVQKMISEFDLCPKLCYIQTDDDDCIGVNGKSCRGACSKKESPEEYNARVQSAIQHIKEFLPTFALLDESRHNNKQACLLMEEGRFYGMGYLPSSYKIKTIEELKEKLEVHTDVAYIRTLILNHAQQFPQKMFSFLPQITIKEFVQEL